MTEVLSKGSPTQALKNSTCTLDLYNIEKRIFIGRSVVYKASIKSSNEPIILKVIPYSPSESNGFETEKRILAKLDHPNIIKFKGADSNIEVKKNQFYSYLALEYAGLGNLLRIVMKRGEMKEKLARNIFHQIVDGVSYMHEMGIAHLDLKLENLLLDKNFQVKITDFDFSQFFSEQRLRNAGSPGCRAPEVKSGISKDFAAADVYSLAVILFNLVAAQSPYSEVKQGETFDFDALFSLLRGNNSKFWEVHSSSKNKESFFGKELISLLNWMWAEKPEDRPSLQEIRNHPWFTHEIYSDEEYRQEMKRYLNI